MSYRSLISTFIALTVLSIPTLLSAQSLDLGSIPKSAFCAGEQFQVNYTVTGAFTSKNSFTLQISDANGSFASAFQNIGSVRTTESGSITATIPSKITAGTGYRFRLISTDPYLEGSDNGANIVVGATPIPKFNRQPIFGAIGAELQFSHDSRNHGSIRWDFGPEADPQFSTLDSPRVRFSTPGFKHVKLTAISAGGCEVTTTSLKDHEFEGLAYVVSCNPRIPANVVVDSTGLKHDTPNYGPYWVVPGGVYDDHGPNAATEFFVEPGGTVDGLSDYSIVYLKAGASMKNHIRPSLVIRELGASLMSGSSRADDIFECADIEFDYSVAPPYKIQQASVSNNSEVLSAVYPNPVSNALYHTESGEKIVALRLYSITGNCVLSQLEPKGRELFSVENLASGLYRLELQYQNRMEFHKILVQH